MVALSPSQLPAGPPRSAGLGEFGRQRSICKMKAATAFLENPWFSGESPVHLQDGKQMIGLFMGNSVHVGLKTIYHIAINPAGVRTCSLRFLHPALQPTITWLEPRADDSNLVPSGPPQKKNTKVPQPSKGTPSKGDCRGYPTFGKLIAGERTQCSREKLQGVD